MPVIRIVLLVVVGGGLALFAFSNLSPVLPLVFLGTQTLALPIAAWIGLAIAAGAFTSFFLQVLSSLQPGYSIQSREEPDEVPRRRSTYRREPPENSESEPQTQYTPPPPPPPAQTPSNRVASDWEERSREDWDFEDEPAAPTSRAPDVEDWQGTRSSTSPRDTPPTDGTNYEVPQEPKTRSQSGSVYSFSYRDTPESGVAKPDQVYDANYRVITPPYQKPPEPSEDEEDWGFEDDEDFDDEAQNKPGRR